MSREISAFPEGEWDDDEPAPRPARASAAAAYAPPGAPSAAASAAAPSAPSTPAAERPYGIEPVRADAANHAEQVTVEVGPGGGLLGLTLTERSKRHGPEHLAATILALVGEATARANEKTRHVLATHVGPIGESDLDGLGIGNDPELAARAELTTPDTWMR